MKKKIFFIGVVISVFLMAFTPGGSDYNVTTLKNVTHRTMYEFKRLELSGNPASDYTLILMEYQRSLNEFTEMAVKYGEPGLAGIIKRQNSELKKAVMNIVCESSPIELLNEIQKTLHQMDTYKETGNVDRDFANIMVIHSTLGKKIAESAKKDEWAKKISLIHEKTIADLNSWLKADKTGEKKIQRKFSPCLFWDMP